MNHEVTESPGPGVMTRGGAWKQLHALPACPHDTQASMHHACCYCMVLLTLPLHLPHTAPTATPYCLYTYPISRTAPTATPTHWTKKVRHHVGHHLAFPEMDLKAQYYIRYYMRILATGNLNTKAPLHVL